jgi:hypothetical protein
MSTELRPPTEDDMPAVLRLTWAQWLLDPPAFVPELWFLALAGDEAAGFAICHPHQGRPEPGWVRILGVRRAWRKFRIYEKVVE